MDTNRDISDTLTQGEFVTSVDTENSIEMEPIRITDKPSTINKETIDDVVITIEHPDDVVSLEATTVGSKALRKKIIREILQPNYYREIENAIRWRRIWFIISVVLFALSGLIKLAQDITLYLNLVVSAQIIGYTYYAILGGAAAAGAAGSKRSAYVNKIISNLGIKDKIPSEDDEDIKDSTSVKNR